jgi:hypothetical protein
MILGSICRVPVSNERAIYCISLVLSCGRFLHFFMSALRDVAKEPEDVYFRGVTKEALEVDKHGFLAEIYFTWTTLELLA